MSGQKFFFCFFMLTATSMIKLAFCDIDVRPSVALSRSWVEVKLRRRSTETNLTPLEGSVIKLRSSQGYPRDMWLTLPSPLNFQCKTPTSWKNASRQRFELCIAWNSLSATIKIRFEPSNETIFKPTLGLYELPTVDWNIKFSFSFCEKVSHKLHKSAASFLFE